MTDNKTQQDGRDRAKVSGSEEYEVEYFAEKYGLLPVQVKDLIARFGNNRAVLEKEAAKLQSDVGP